VDRQEQALLSIVPRDSNTGFDMRHILQMIFDHGSVFEIGALYGPSQICALATLNGQPVGVLANDCLHYAGAMTAEAAQKVPTIRGDV
jgi:propionyl-CoA carboxylase beta chain